MNSRRLDRRAGYSLVEMTLALLVAGLGIMALFALFPQGLDASRKSVDATEVGAFGDFVLSSLQIKASHGAGWSNFGNGLVLNGSDALRGLADEVDPQPLVEAAGPGTAQLMYWEPGELGQAKKDTEIPVYEMVRFTYTLDIGGIGKTNRYARLEVWPGDRTNVVQQALDVGKRPRGSTVFYREYRPPQ